VPFTVSPFCFCLARGNPLIRHFCSAYSLPYLPLAACFASPAVRLIACITRLTTFNKALYNVSVTFPHAQTGEETGEEGTEAPTDRGSGSGW